MRSTQLLSLIVWSSLLLCSSCFPKSLKKYRDIYYEGVKTISFTKKSTHNLEIMYTGCGGLLIHTEQESILVDPFYSNTGLLKHIGKLKTDKAQTDSIFQKFQQQQGNAQDIHNILVAHSHYDHLMDLPYVLNKFLSQNNPQIIGSASTQNALAAMHLAPYRFRIPDLSRAKTFDSLRISESILLYSIYSEHAPHARFLGMPIQFMKGDIGTDGVKGFDTPDYKAGYSRWKEGIDYSFMLELRQPDRSRPFRIFIQSSSCPPPAGIPSYLPPGDSVDLAFIGVASANLVDDYPMQLLSALRPRYVILIHWEDFFRRYRKDPKIVRGTHFKVFLRRYQSVMGSGYAARSSMPRQGTLYRIHY